MKKLMFSTLAITFLISATASAKKCYIYSEQELSGASKGALTQKGYRVLSEKPKQGLDYYTVEIDIENSSRMYREEKVWRKYCKKWQNLVTGNPFWTGCWVEVDKFDGYQVNASVTIGKVEGEGFSYEISAETFDYKDRSAFGESRDKALAKSMKKVIPSCKSIE